MKGKNLNSWPIYLPYITFAYNASPSRITGFAPYELMFGRRVALPAISPVDDNVLPTKAEQLNYFFTVRNALKEANEITTAALERNESNYEIFTTEIESLCDSNQEIMSSCIRDTIAIKETFS